MEQQTFKRAKSNENKTIRMSQILEVTDALFHKYSYHDITLSIIAGEMNLARSGLYKYVTTKEEIFLAIYIQKEKTLMDELCLALIEVSNLDDFANIMSEMLYKHHNFIKYHQILTAIIETNVTIEKLAEFKLATRQNTLSLFEKMQDLLSITIEDAFDLYLTILYHSVYLYDRVMYRDQYVEAMKLANLKINEIDFKEALNRFVSLHVNSYLKK